MRWEGGVRCGVGRGEVRRRSDLGVGRGELGRRSVSTGVR